MPITARTVGDIVDALHASTELDMTVDPSAHHDLLDHGLQTAAVLRTSRPDDAELQVAGLVHDLGHILPPATRRGTAPSRVTSCGTSSANELRRWFACTCRPSATS